MAFDKTKNLRKLDKKVFLATATMHGEEMKYIQEAYDTNWMTTVGKKVVHLVSVVVDTGISTCQHVGYF